MGMAIQAKNAAFFTYKNRKKTGNFSATGGVDKATSGENTARKNTAKQEKLTEKIRGLNRPVKQQAYHGSKVDDEEEKSFISADRKNYVYQDTSESKINGCLNTKTTSTKSSENKTKKKLHYNYKDVSSQIQRAKTSASAGQAVLKAKRNVLELKRKLGSSEEDAEEVQAALNHAKAVERVARKKKRNLEMEELVAHTQKQDEQAEETGGTGSGREDMLQQAEERVSDAQSEIDAMQTEKLTEAAESLRESMGGSTDGASAEAAFSDTLSAGGGTSDMLSLDGEFSDILSADAPFSDEMLATMDEMLEGFGEAEQEMLQETMEQLELMEVVDPHMSEADLDDLKRKHRNAERKEIVKAEMEYLKATFDSMQKKAAELSSPASGSYGSFSGGMPAATVNLVSAPSADGAALAMSGFEALG